MSQACTASRGSAPAWSRAGRARGRSLRRTRRRRAPASPRPPGRRRHGTPGRAGGVSASSTAAASPISPNAGYVVPIRSGVRRSGRCVRPEPASSRRSSPTPAPTPREKHVRALEDLRAGSGRSTADPANSAWSFGKGPLAHERGDDRRVETLGKDAQPVPGPRAQNAASRPDDRALCRRQQRAASATSAAGRERKRRRACVQLADRAERASPVRKSTGISTNTGPVGGVSARRQASASAPGISSERPRPARPLHDRRERRELVRAARAGTRGRGRAARSGSARRPPPPERGSSPPPSAWRARSAPPGPVERTSGAGRPLTRAYPSAAKPAFSSLRNAMLRAGWYGAPPRSRGRGFPEARRPCRRRAPRATRRRDARRYGQRRLHHSASLPRDQRRPARGEARLGDAGIGAGDEIGEHGFRSSGANLNPCPLQAEPMTIAADPLDDEILVGSHRVDARVAAGRLRNEPGCTATDPRGVTRRTAAVDVVRALRGIDRVPGRAVADLQLGLARRRAGSVPARSEPAARGGPTR